MCAQCAQRGLERPEQPIYLTKWETPYKVFCCSSGNLWTLFTAALSRLPDGKRGLETTLTVFDRGCGDGGGGGISVHGGRANEDGRGGYFKGPSAR